MKRKTYDHKFLGQIFLVTSAIIFLQISASAVTFTVTNTSDSGPGSLRQAIADASNPGFDTVNFNIPLSDPNCNVTTRVCTIIPLSNLPSPSSQLIDGYTQPDATVNTLAFGTNAVLKIEIKGRREIPGAFPQWGLSLFQDSEVRGLIINNFIRFGVRMGQGTTVVGCFIGTDATGTIAIPNSRNAYDDSAVSVEGNGNKIGIAVSASPAERNLISGNLAHGILLPNTGGSGESLTFNRIQNNLIGTKADGVSPLGNGLDGIFFRNITSGAINDNFIMNNVIAFNAGVGVNIAHGGVGTNNPPLYNQILANSIFSNGKIGISLGSFLGETNVNDPCDGDSGQFSPNDAQNYPVITSSSTSAGNFLVNGFLNSNATGTYNLQFFASDFCDFRTTKGEGKTYLGSLSVTDTDGDCNSNFNASFPVPPGAGKVITSTATDSDGNTSGFSGCMVAGAACEPAPSNIVSLYRGENNANDSRGVNPAAAQNGAGYTPGLVGQAFSFDGVDDVVTVPNSPSLNFGMGSFTVETWVKFNTLTAINGTQVILKKRSPAPANFPGWYLEMHNNINYSLRLDVFSAGGGTTIYSDTAIYPDDWVHIAFVVDRTTNTVRLYVNGAVQTAQPSIAGFTTFDTSVPLYVGNDDENHALNGQIDETAIYNRALTETEIQAIYFAGGSGKCFVPTSASVSVGGRVLSDSGRGIYKTHVTLTDINGTSRTTLTNPFGYYRFDGVAVGQSYVASVRHKAYQFANPSRILFVTDNISDADFIALNQAATNSKPSISGRVTNAKGEGLADVSIELSTASSKQPLIVKTDEYGGYIFEDLTVGETYFINVDSKLHGFDNPLRVFTLLEDVTDADFASDGKFDAGVVRPTSTTWFVQRSTAGTLIQQFGALGDLPVRSAFVP